MAILVATSVPYPGGMWRDQSNPSGGDCKLQLMALNIQVPLQCGPRVPEHFMPFRAGLFA